MNVGGDDRRVHSYAPTLARLTTRIPHWLRLRLTATLTISMPRCFPKPHRGQQRIAVVAPGLGCDQPPRNGQRLQDRYLIRCAPMSSACSQTHCLGCANPLKMASANDNPT
jgi:hypothetical protein